MKIKNRIIFRIITIFILSVIGFYGYSIFEKNSKVKWLSNLDVSSTLIEVGDLPPGYSSGAVKSIESDDSFRFVQAIQQEILASDGSQAGEVRVYLFLLKSEQEKMYNLLSLMETPEGMIPYDVIGIGEMQLAVVDPMEFIVFTRCAGIGYIMLDPGHSQEGYSFDYLIAHAKYLDERLKSIICK